MKGQTMKCEILVSERMGGIPIAECGGVVLQPGDKLIVSCELAGEMRKHYDHRIVGAGYVEYSSLKNGHYQYESGNGKAVAHAAAHIGEAAPALETPSSDKSMQGKHKMRRKG